jgi:hypothetical protein
MIMTAGMAFYTVCSSASFCLMNILYNQIFDDILRDFVLTLEP